MDIWISLYTFPGMGLLGARGRSGSSVLKNVTVIMYIPIKFGRVLMMGPSDTIFPLSPARMSVLVLPDMFSSFCSHSPQLGQSLLISLLVHRFLSSATSYLWDAFGDASELVHFQL